METSFSEEKVMYLQMLQEPIGRMSSTSAIFKGFAATIVAGVSALAFEDINKWILLLAFLPLLCFAFMDGYYLWQERKFKYVYDQVRIDMRPVDFLMKVRLSRDERNKANMTLIGSVSIWPFYLPIFSIAATITILKFLEVL